MNGNIVKSSAVIVAAFTLFASRPSSPSAQDCLPYEDYTHLKSTLVYSTGVPGRLSLDGDRAVGANGIAGDYEAWGGLDLFSLADPAAPELLGSWIGDARIPDAKLSGNLVYYLYDTTLRVMDFTDPGNPLAIGTSPTLFGICSRLALAGELAYVTCESGHFTVVDIQDPAAPHRVHSQELGTALHDLILAWGHAFCTGEDESIKVLDLSNPREPVLVNSVDTYGAYPEIDAGESHVYVAGEGLKIYLWMGNGELELRGGVHETQYGGGGLADILVQESLAVVINGGGSYLEDVSIAADPQRLLEFDFDAYYDSEGLSVALGEEYLYILRGHREGWDIPPVEWPVGTLQSVVLNNLSLAELPWTLDTSEAEQPRDFDADIVERIRNRGRNSAGMALGSSPGQLYTVNYNIFKELDITDPASPSVVRELVIESLGQGIDVEGDLAGVDWYTGSDWGFQVIDLKTFTVRGQVSGEGWCDVRDCEIRDGFAYLAVGNRGFWICSLANPNPAKIGGWDITAYDVELRDDFAFVVSSSYLYIFDVSDPFNGQILEIMVLPSGLGRDLTLSGEFGYIGDDRGRLIMLDLSQPNMPAFVDSVNLGGEVYRLDSLGSMGLVSTRWPQNQIHILSFDPPALPEIVGTVQGEFESVLIAPHCIIASCDGLRFGPLPCWITALPETPVAAERWLMPAYPNPFNPATTLEMNLPRSGRARLAVVGVDGRLRRVLLDGELAAGRHHFTWDGRDDEGRPLSSGIYLARLQSGERKEAGKLILLR